MPETSKYSFEYFFNSETVVVFLALVLAGLAAYSYLYPSYPDINEFFLHEQSSVATIRLPAETAIYRSKVTPHGRQLISGLSIADNAQNSYSTRDGNVLDIWRLTLKNTIPLATAVSDGGGIVGNFVQVPLSNEELELLVHAIGQKFASWTKRRTKSTGKVDPHVVIALGSSLESLICFFAATLYGFSAVFLHEFQNTDETGLNELIELADPDILVSSGSILNKLEFERFLHLEGIVSVNARYFDIKTKELLPAHVAENYITWPDLVSKAKSTESKIIQELTHTPEIPVKVAYLSKELPVNSSNIDNLPYDNIQSTLNQSEIAHRPNKQLACFTDKAIVSSIAAQIKAIPASHQWSTKDSILTFNSQFNGYSFVLQLCALVSGSRLIFVDSSNIVYHPLKLLSDIGPTVMITEDSVTRTLVGLADDLSIFNSLRFYRAQTELSKGRLPDKSILAELKSLRLIHSGAYTQGQSLSTEDTNTIRALSGAYLIHSLNTPLSLSPIAQTAIYDYRTSNALRWIHFGPPLPCLEIKLRDFRNYHASNRMGQLLLKGNSLPSGTEWVEENLIARLGTDGCVKQLLNVDYSISK
ncbi:hypothetical protein AWJ20_3518 [Sugiyamaella lignohabitans]|uniref:AMP-dependent synthetase/ligase domain-containing protein n=1 Tax=Sugiyamaella lignohabitans TaxID=796027 RepID=A0A167FYQ6_9ASCO|nr:uncharacterized protein AWJ20_3518 [Sugiyamaella lignohabitans]ANB15874.1 hypothetical protein AWJ20_3518 [Sugiyamaella lignohabitans]